MSMVGFPLLLIPLAIYNIIVFLMPGVSFADPLVTITLMSGVGWPVTLGDMLLALGIVLLLFEIIKGARPGAKYLTDHLLSLVVFGAAAAEFLLWPQFGHSIYGLLALLALVDFLSGIALRARRGVPAAAGATSRRAARKSEAAAPQPAPVPSLNRLRHPDRRCRRPRLSQNRCCGIIQSRPIRPSRSFPLLRHRKCHRRDCSPAMARRPRQTRRHIRTCSVLIESERREPFYVTCRGRIGVRCTNAGLRGRRSGHRRELRGASCGSAAPARPSRSDA